MGCLQLFEVLILPFNLVGITLEIIGFILMLKATVKLTLKSTLPNHTGMFDADEYVDPKTSKPPPHIESSPRPRIYRPAIGIVIFGLSLQLVSIIIQQLSLL